MNKIPVIVFFVLLAFHVQGQVQIGFQGGTNLSKMDFTKNPDFSYKDPIYTQGFMGGLVFKYDNTTHAGIQLEINMVQKGWSETEDVRGEDTTKYKRVINYIEVPFLSSFNIGGGNFRVVIDMGCYGGYALSAKQTEKNIFGGSQTTTDYVFDKDQDNRLDFGLVAGAGFEYRLPFGTIATELRYNLGLGNINKVRSVQAELSQNRNLALLFRYTFLLGKRMSSKSETDLQ